MSRRLVSLRADVRIVDNLERGKVDNLGDALESIEVLIGDLREPQVCARAFSDTELVFHLASKVGGFQYYVDRPYEVLDANAQIDSNVLRSVIHQKVGHYFYASSAHIYPVELQQSADAPAISEHQDVPAHPELSYGWAKLLGEKAVQYALQEGVALRASIGRIIGAYGPNQDIDLATGSAIPVFVRRAVEYPQRSPFVVRGTGAETRSYCYIDDVVDGILLSTAKTTELNLVGPFNLGRAGRNTIREIAETVVKVSGKDIPIVYDTSVPTAIWGQALDCSYATQLLDGWSPKVSLLEGVAKCYEDIQSRLSAAGAAV